MKIQEHLLNNGLKVIFVDGYSSTAAAVFATLAGSTFEPDNLQGLAHYLEHTVFKGTKKRPTPSDVVAGSEGIGGAINASTGHELMTFQIQLTPEKIQEGLEHINELTLHAIFPESEVKREKEVVIEEARMYHDDHASFSYTQALEALFKGSHWAFPIIGYEKSLHEINTPDLKDFYTTRFQPEESVLVVYGKFNQPTQLLRYIDSIYNVSPSKFKVGKTKAEKTTTAKFNKTADYAYEGRKIKQAYLTAATSSIKATHPDYLAARIATTILGGGMGSKLFREVREKSGLCYYIYSQIAAHIHNGYTIIAAGLNTDQLPKAGDLIRKQISEMIKGKITNGELNRAKLLTKTSLLSLYDDPMEAAHQIAEDYLELGKIETPDKLAKKIDGVTVAKIAQISEQIFDFTQGVVSVVGPEGQIKQAEELKAILK
jgi:predicted Zn-dependent peptidase